MLSQRILAGLEAGSASIVTVALVIAAVGSAPSTAAAAAQMTEICHFNADNDPGVPEWELLSIGGGKSVERHFAHGDGLPGNEVPNTGGGAIFDAQCGVVIIDQDGDGILDEDDNCPAVANSDQSNRYGSTKGDACEDDYNDNGIVDTEEDWVCVSIDGVVVLWQILTPLPPEDVWCTTTPSTGDTSNVAISTGAYVPATATLGNGNIAIADSTTGFAPAPGSVSATASGGHFNYAYAYGPGSNATAGPGNYNTAIAIWDGVALSRCTAVADAPDGETVIVTECNPL